MSILSDIWQGVKTTLIGLKITTPYIWKKPITVQYPHARIELPQHSRNRLYVNMDDCIGCDQCSRACPVNCITIETAKSTSGDNPGTTSNGKKKSLWVTKFDIDIAKCCYCGLCTFPCPTECIVMTNVYEFAEEERNNLIYNYITLTPEEVQKKIALSNNADALVAAAKSGVKPAESAISTVPTAPVSTGDSEKDKKIAEMQAKIAAAKAKTGIVDQAPSVNNLEDEKARKIAEMKAKIEALKKAKGV